MADRFHSPLWLFVAASEWIVRNDGLQKYNGRKNILEFGNEFAGRYDLNLSEGVLTKVGSNRIYKFRGKPNGWGILENSAPVFVTGEEENIMLEAIPSDSPEIDLLWRFSEKSGEYVISGIDENGRLRLGLIQEAPLLLIESMQRRGDCLLVILGGGKQDGKKLSITMDLMTDSVKISEYDYENEIPRQEICQWEIFSGFISNDVEETMQKLRGIYSQGLEAFAI